MKLLIRILILALAAGGYSVVSLAYYYIRPTPVWNLVMDEDYLVSNCRRNCVKCFLREAGEPIPSMDEKVNRCLRLQVKTWRQILFQAYSEQAFEYALSRLDDGSNRLYEREFEMLLWEYDNYVKKYNRTPSKQEMDSLFGLALK